MEKEHEIVLDTLEILELEGGAGCANESIMPTFPDISGQIFHVLRI
jgi:hypothetical protein